MRLGFVNIHRSIVPCECAGAAAYCSGVNPAVSEKDGWEATIEELKTFLVFSLGEPEPEYAGSADALTGVTAPAALSALHAFAANWPCEHNGRVWPLFGGYWPQNQLLTPDAWWDQDEFTVFASENQGVCTWAFRTEDAGAPSPTVFCNMEGWGWTNEEPLAEFLLAWCMLEVSIRRGVHGPARVLRLVEPMTPMIATRSPNFGSFELYDNKVLIAHTDHTVEAAVVGVDAPDVTLGDAADPYRSVALRFRFDKVMWRVVLDEFGGGRATCNRDEFDVRGVVPAACFDELFNADTASESSESRLAYLTASEPKAEIVRNWAHTIRHEGYIDDALTASLFGYLATNAELAPLVGNKSPFG